MGRNRAKLIGGVVVTITLVYAYFKAVAFQKANALAAPLSRTILRRLAAHRREYPDNPYLSITHLRDELLESLPSRERASVWARVKRLVEGNSNVRTAGGEIRGDFHRTWEWVGDLNAFKGEEVFSSSPSYASMRQVKGNQDWSSSVGRVYA